MPDPTSVVLALGDIAELLAEHDAAHLFAGVVAVLEPHVTNDDGPTPDPVLPVDTFLWLLGLLDRDVDLHTGKAVATLLGVVRPFLAGPSKPFDAEIPLGDGTGEKLTAREYDVLRGMAGGGTNRAIGKALFLSEDTVKTHLRTLFRKLGVNNRAHAVACGYELGLIPTRFRRAA